jgi:hypothetical protein
MAGCNIRVTDIEAVCRDWSSRGALGEELPVSLHSHLAESTTPD